MNKLQVVLVFDPQFFYPMLLLAKNALTIGRIFLVSTKRKCIDMSMENNDTDVRVYRKKNTSTSDTNNIRIFLNINNALLHFPARCYIQNSANIFNKVVNFQNKNSLNLHCCLTSVNTSGTANEKNI